MEFVNNIDKDEYEYFVKKHKTKSHFLQSYAWGQFCKESKNENPYYVGVKEGKKLIATALLLETKLPFGYTKYYSPRGFVLDYNNYELISFFTEELKKFLNEKKAISFKIDPDIIWNKIDKDNNVIELNNNHEQLFNFLIKIGYKHLGFTKNFETMQPRYTFRIDFNKDFQEIENNLSKTTKQRIKKSKDFNPKIRIGNINDIDTFNNLMTITENRKNFTSHNLNYYKKLYEIYNKDNDFNIFLGSINTKELLEKYANENKEIKDKLDALPKENLSKNQNTQKKELSNQLEKNNLFIKELEDAKENYGEEIVLNAHAIIEYNDKAWVLYAGNHNVLTSTYSNYYTYYYHLKYCYDKGIKVYDQFGTIGDLNSKNPRLGLHEFKKKFGGDYVEFMGEFDYIIRKKAYYLFTFLIKIRRKLLKLKNKFNKK